LSKPIAASLEVTTPDGARRIVPLSERPLTLGRATTCDIVIEEPFVSGCHARIEFSGDRYVLRDAGSTNGTWLDGFRINGGKELFHGSVVVLGQPGNYRLRFLTPPALESKTATNRNLRDVLEISKALLTTLELEEVLRRVLDACLRIAQAERGYLFLREGGDLKLRASRDEVHGETTPQQVEFSRSIALRVAETGQPEFLTDLDGDTGLDKSASIVRLRLRSVACVPLKIQQRVIGIVYLDSHRPAARPGATDRDVVEVLAGLAAVAIENARLIGERVQNERWMAIGRMAGSIVHDIRNPLTALRGTAELLARKISDPEQQRKVRSMIEEVDRLSSLSGEMLEFSSGTLPLNRSQVSLAAMVRGFLRTIEPRLEKEQIHLEVRLDQDGNLALDRQKMVRVLHNIVGNALEAMRPGGILTIESFHRDRQIVLAISDTGSGMDPQVVSRIFEPFFTHGKVRGIGLGMATVRRIVEQHGAAISVESTPGSGTLVEVLFPLLEPAQSAESPR